MSLSLSQREVLPARVYLFSSAMGFELLEDGLQATSQSSAGFQLLPDPVVAEPSRSDSAVSAGFQLWSVPVLSGPSQQGRSDYTTGSKGFDLLITGNSGQLDVGEGKAPASLGRGFTLAAPASILMQQGSIDTLASNTFAQKPSSRGGHFVAANMSRMVQAAHQAFGQDFVSRRCPSNVVVHSLFTGIGGGEAALEGLFAFCGQGTKVQPGVCADMDKTVQKFLAAAFPERCRFSDVNSFVDAQGELSELVWCEEHKRMCPLFPVRPPDVVSVMVCTGPCQAHSRFGKRHMFEDPRTKCHATAKRILMKGDYDFVFLENVPQFPMAEYIQDMQEKYTCVSQVLDPRMFGAPVARERLMAACCRRDRWQWARNIQEVLQVLRTPPNCLCDKLVESSLSRPGRLTAGTMSNHLQAYREVLQEGGRSEAGSLMWDLSQNPHKRPRLNRQDGSLQTLMTSTVLYSPKHDVVLNGVDMLSAMGFVVTEEAAEKTGSDRWRRVFTSSESQWSDSSWSHFIVL